VRALFTLIKRQIVDNAVYFLAAIVVSAVLIIAIISITFSEDFLDLSLYTIILIITAPVIFGIGSYILGLIQMYSDKTSGVTAVLSVLPVKHGRLFLTRLITGTLVILTLLGPLAITGAILWELLGPPDWLFHNWLADTFIGISLMALACYCLGLVAARKAETFTSALRALLLVPILMLLIVIKGFGWPLLVVLLPFLAVFLFRCWKQDSNRFMTIFATGFTALVLAAIPLYFGRNFCDGLLARLMDVSAKVSPSGLLPPEIENDPNVESHSEASVRYRGGHYSIIERFLRYDWASELLKETFSIIEPLGITEYFRSLERGIRYMYTQYDFEPRLRLVHLDETEGHLVYRCKYLESYTDEHTWNWKDATKIYFGPKGFSDTPNNKSGQFKSPVIYRYSESANYRYRPPKFVVYDANSHCFFAIDFRDKTVHKGPNLQDSEIQPIDIGQLGKSDVLRIGISRPSSKYGLRIRIGARTRIDYLPIVDESGQINLLDPNTLGLYRPSVFLPRPKTLFGRASSKPKHLLDYDVDLLGIAPYDKHSIYGGFPTYSMTNETGEYLGLVAGSLSRQGMWTSVAVFDKDGNKIRSADSKATFFDVPGGPVLTITKYIFESLHPPVLTLASFFTAYSFDARSAYRALFLMPNSFVAMARDYEGNVFYMLLIVLSLMLPGILFAALLGWRVTRDATILGLSRNAKRFWLAGTIIFGLPAYITYRLTRPKITLVTCANCGKPRRPDMDICHRCGSKWDMPELKPPAWRVLNGAE